MDLIAYPCWDQSYSVLVKETPAAENWNRKYITLTAVSSEQKYGSMLAFWTKCSH